MRRLFGRLYALLLLVVLITTFATVLTVVFARWQNDVRVSEDALRGGAYLAAQKVFETPEGEREALLASLGATFGRPLSLHEISEGEMTPSARERIADGEVVLIGAKFDRLAVRVGDEARRLEIGPFADYPLPGWELFAVVFLLAALGGALLLMLLRRLHRQLQLVRERMLVFAGGDLDARIDLKQMHDLSSLGRVLNETVAASAHALRAQRELLQAVSHELRTPLARIRFGAALLVEENSEDARQQRWSELDRSITETDSLVDELLNYVRAESSAPQEELSLRDLLSALIEDASLDSTPENSDAPQVRLGPMVALADVAVHANEMALHRALSNLVSNAKRYARQEVVVDAETRAEGVFVYVDDDGPGLDASLDGDVFEPFVRTPDSPGVGLGLAITKRVVSKLGGSLEVSPSPLGGCRMQITIPRHRN
jgi:two-component system sensor histidine kinase RstB